MSAPLSESAASESATSNSGIPIPESCIEIDLLGGLRIRRRTGQPTEEISVPGVKAQHLLAYLLLHPQAVHTREKLVELLWPDMPPARSRRNLSDILYRVRQLLPGEWLQADAGAIGLRAESGLQVDVWTFQQAVQRADSSTLAQAVALYRAPLLPDLYEDWLEPHRRALHEQFLGALTRLAEQQEAAGALDEAHQTWLRALQTEPLLEVAYRGSMRVLAKRNRLPEALDVYERLVDLLEQDVAAPPAPETRELADALFRELELARASVQQETVWRPRFVGRTRERREILTAIEAALRGSGCALAVDGPGGMGKTRLLEEVADSARWRGAGVMWGRASRLPAASPLAPLREAVTAALEGPRAAQMATLLDRETLLVLGQLYAPWATLGEPTPLPPEQARGRFLNCVVMLFSTLADLTPQVLILDDLHWADPTLWFLLDGLVNRCGAMPLTILCSYRRDAIEAGPGWDYLQNWEREDQIRIYSLGPLDQEDISALLGPEQATQAEGVWAGSGGNPFYVVQALAALSEGAQPTARSTRARVAELDPPARAALETAAILGRTVPYALLAAGVELTPRALIRAGDELVDRHLLEPIENGYRFTHDLVQEAVYQEIDAARRQELHGQTARILADIEPENLRSRAYHLEQGEQLVQAGTVYAEVARQDAAHFAYAEAKTALVKAAEYLPSAISVERVELLLELARLASIGNAMAQAQAALEEARTAAHTLDRQDLTVAIQIQMADLAARTGRHDDAEADFAAAWALVQQQAAAADKLAVLLPWSDFLSRVGRLEQARANFEQAIALARATNDKDREGRALEGMGWVLAGLGGSAETVVDYMEQALAAHEIGGNRFEEARTRVNLFSSLQHAGMWDRLLELEAPMLESLRRVGYRRGEASAQQAICWMHLGLGDFEAAHRAGLQAQTLFTESGEMMGASLAISALGAILMQQDARAAALPYLEQALGITKELGSDTFEAYAHHELGVYFLKEAGYAEAREQFMEACERWTRVGDPFNLVRSRTRLAQAHLGEGENALATELADAAWANLESEIPQSYLTLDWLFALYELCGALGRSPQQKQIIEQAYRELLTQAAKIVDSDVRRRFLENVPVNRSIIDAYDAAFGVVRGSTVALARADAPLGRALGPADTVEIWWTTAAPDDEAIAERTARRRHVLQRLQREAAAQGAVPTDDDLATALGVSRRTILRDIQALAEDGILIATRARAPKN